MLYNKCKMTFIMVYYITCVMSYHITCVMLCYVIQHILYEICYVMLNNI